ncbi:MAG: M23 family metallopeptidase [Bacteroidales bacterium]|nr:M23 family metallopeptidase [Bacteroidales bacterium]
MERYKYKYNPRTVSYEKVKLTWKDKFMRFLTYFAATLVLAVLYNLIFGAFFDTPREKELIRENNQLQLQYEILNEKFDRVENVLKDLQERDNNIYRVIFETDPIPSSVREAGYGGSENYEELRRYENSDLIIRTATKLDKLSKQLYVQSKSYDELISLAKNKEEMLSSVPAIMPVSNEDLTRTASGFGWRIHPIYKIRKLHEGMDFTAPVGTKIYATGDGIVETVKNSKRGYGKRVIINHGFGYKTRYAHLNEFNVRRGEEVQRGDVIGYVGNSGLSVAPHLHYEVEKDNEKVNPVHYYFNDLTPEQYEKMIFISSNSGQSLD